MLKILHTGQTGVERGADHAARALGIPIAGFCQRDRRDEIGFLPAHIAADLTPVERAGSRAVWAPTLEKADALVIVVPATAAAKRSPGIGVLQTLARAARVPQVVVDPTSDFDAVARQLAEAHAGHHELSVMICGPRRTRWPNGEATGLQMTTALAAHFQGVRHRVLIVEDHPPTAELTCDLVKMLGHDCVSASNAREALALVDAVNPDIGLVDIQLPDMNGYDLAARVRRHATQPLFLAAVTGWEEAHSTERASAAGFDHLVIKPLGVDLIRDIFEVAVSRLATSWTTMVTTTPVAVSPA